MELTRRGFFLYLSGAAAICAKTFSPRPPFSALPPSTPVTERATWCYFRDEGDLEYTETFPCYTATNSGTFLDAYISISQPSNVKALAWVARRGPPKGSWATFIEIEIPAHSSLVVVTREPNTPGPLIQAGDMLSVHFPLRQLANGTPSRVPIGPVEVAIRWHADLFEFPTRAKMDRAYDELRAWREFQIGEISRTFAIPRSNILS